MLLPGRCHRARGRAALFFRATRTAGLTFATASVRSGRNRGGKFHVRLNRNRRRRHAGERESNLGLGRFQRPAAVVGSAGFVGRCDAQRRVAKRRPGEASSAVRAVLRIERSSLVGAVTLRAQEADVHRVDVVRIRLQQPNRQPVGDRRTRSAMYCSAA